MIERGLNISTWNGSEWKGVHCSRDCEWRGVGVPGSALTHLYFSGPSAPPPRVYLFSVFYYNSEILNRLSPQAFM